MPTDCTARLVTPPNANGAIAAIQLTAPAADALDAALDRITGKPAPLGALLLRDIAAIDRGLVARPSHTTAFLMPHGGALLVRSLITQLASLGIETHPAEDDADPRAIFPEAQDIFEACALSTIARTASRIAPQIILRQAQLGREGAVPITDDQTTARLNRLIHPPTVAVIGAPNIGKSSLMNALARRAVAATADEPATTRDAVGVSLDLAGLAVHWIDTAGQGASKPGIDAQAERAARDLAARADLVISCADATTDYLPDPSESVIRCATRADLHPRADADVATSVKNARGIRELAQFISQTLVPDEDRQVAQRWRFHPALP